MKLLFPIAIVILIQIMPIVALSNSEILPQFQQIVASNKTLEQEALINTLGQVQHGNVRKDIIRF